MSGERQLYLAANQGLYSGFPGKKDWELIKSTENLSINDLDFCDSSQAKLLLAADSGIYILETRSERLRKQSIPIYSRSIYSVLTDSTYSYIGTDMGVFRSDNAGKTWKIQVDGLPYASVRRLHKVGNRLFCGTNIGVFFSDNDAETWKQGDGIFPIEIVSIAGGPENGQIFASDLNVGYLFESRDHGTSWNPINLGTSISRVSALHLTRSGKLLAGTVAEGIVLIIPKSEDEPVENSGTN